MVFNIFALLLKQFVKKIVSNFQGLMSTYKMLSKFQKRNNLEISNN